MPDVKLSKAAFAGVFLVSGATLMNELLLLRIFSVTMWYHFAFLTISLAMLGMSAAGALLYAAPRFFTRERMGGQLVRLTLLYALALTAAIFIYLHLPPPKALMENPLPGLSVREPSVYIPFSLFLPPFFLGGFIVALLFTHRPESASGIYFADLAGAAAGCLGAIALTSFITGPEAVVVSSGTIFLAAHLFASAFGGRRSRALSLLCSVLCFAFPFANRGTNLLRITVTKDYVEKGVVLESWNPISRITVFDDIFWKRDASGFGWGKTANAGSFKPREMWIEQDAGAGTPITEFKTDLHHYNYLDEDVTFAAYALGKFQNAFIIGPGGGRDILAALHFGVPRVVAAELNPNIVRIVDQSYGNFSGHIYSYPGVETRIGDGRTSLRQSGEKFDLIQISLIDSFAATLAGAFALAENNLYTVEAFRLYLDHLNPDGVLTVSHWLSPGTLRMMVLAWSALERTSVRDPGEHIAVIQNMGVATMIVKRTPFTAADCDRLTRNDTARGFDELVMARCAEAHPIYQPFMRAPDKEQFARDYPDDVTATTDDRPFFFQMQKSFGSKGAGGHWKAFRLLGMLFIWVAAVTLLMVILPMAFPILGGPSPIEAWRIFHSNLSALAYFAALGVAYMMVEISLVQRFVLFLGHPLYAASVVLTSMLFFSGLGSLSTRRLAGSSRVVVRLAAVLVSAICFLALLAILLGPAFLAFQGWPLAGKVFLSILILGALGFLMGVPFPCGLKLIGAARRDEVIPWMWGMNGACSVLASVGAMILAIRYGYSYCLLLGMGCYLAALLLAYLSLGKIRNPNREMTQAS